MKKAFLPSGKNPWEKLPCGRAFFSFGKKPLGKLACGKAQIGLEYLMTYSWALVLIASIIGVVVLLFGSPAETPVFNSSQPIEFPLVGGNIDASNKAGIVIKNATSGTITVTKCFLTSGFNDIPFGSAKLNTTACASVSPAAPVNVPPGDEIMFSNMTFIPGLTGIIELTYKDKTGFSRKLTITGRKGTQTAGAYCGDGSCTGSEDEYSCPADCGGYEPGDYCGDGYCTGSEDGYSCPEDCGGYEPGDYCGDGYCTGSEDSDPYSPNYCPEDCAICGNNTKESGEVCDGTDFGGLDCSDYGFVNGTLACHDCSTIDTSGCATPVAGLAAYWKFDEGTGTSAADSSGNGNAGNLYAGASWATACPNGKCLQLNGSTTGYVQVADSASIEPANITASLWIKPTVWSGGSVTAFITKRPAASTGYFIFRYTLNHIFVDFGGNGSRWDTGYIPPLGQWTHLVYTYDGTNGKFYVNGDLGGRVTTKGIPANVPTTANLRIGLDSYAAQYYFTGSMDEVKIYNRALSAAEVCNDCKYYAASVGVACGC